MEFTGERFVPTLQGDIRLEHFHRYEWCLPYVAGRKVLDIACGEGYGSRILARTAASVIGVDIADEAVSHAQQVYAGVEHLSFRQGDAAEIPLPDHSVEVVVSFETIEHHDRHVEMISEIRRVLTEDGLLIISSPNKKIYSDLAGGDHNHFHVKELYFSEFDALLRDYFSSVAHFGQRVTAGSLLLPLQAEAPGTALSTYTETSSGVLERNPQHIEPMYYLAVAANRPLPPLPAATAYFSEIDNPFYEKQREVLELGKEIRRMSDYIAEANTVLQTRDSDLRQAAARVQEFESLLATTQAERHEARLKLAESESSLTQAQASLLETQARLGDTEAHLAAILNSRSWRLIQKLRALLGRK